MQDRRKTARKKTFLGARVIFNHRQSTMDCLVRNIGDDGARLSFSGPAPFPDQVEVEVVRMDKTFRARVAWRRENELGVRFLAADSASNVIPIGHALKLRRLQADKARLESRVLELTSGA
jgi:hypothetical protein